MTYNGYKKKPSETLSPIICILDVVEFYSNAEIKDIVCNTFKKLNYRNMGPILRCDSHPNSVLIEDHRAGDMICSMCGLVVGDRIVDVSSEWRKSYEKKNEIETL
jgi:hypothetical protein